ncbi:MAG: site-specific integrase [Roseiarcus sp.]
MGRTVRDTNLETRAARLRLAARRKPRWRVLDSGLHLGYRSTKKGAGSWVARRFLGDGRYKESGIGSADDLQDADGLSFLSFKQAQAKAREWWSAAEHAEHGFAPFVGAYTVAIVLDAYFADREKRGSKGVAKDRAAARARILPALGEAEVTGLTMKQIRDWHTGLATTPKLTRAPRMAKERKSTAGEAISGDATRARRATANRTLTVLKAALNHAFHEGRAPTDAAWRKVKPFREVDAPVVQFLSEDECRRIVNASEGAFRDLVRAALLSGCRYGELARMRAGDFNVEAGTITVRESKSGKPRHVALTDEGRSLFAGLTAGQASPTPIFVREDGKTWGPSHQQRPLEAACKRGKIEPAATFQILRHTYASALAMRGVPMGVIAAQLGHSDTRMTEKHYAHLSPNYVAETVRAALPALGILGDRSDSPMRRLA